jgi:predicted PurR-regulated permease PerM
MITPRSQDLTRTTLGVLFIGVLIVACFWVLRPFIPSLMWATMIVVATWPLMLRAQALLWGKRALAVTVMTLALLLMLVVPLSLAIVTIVAHAEIIVDWAKSLATLTVPPPPDWVAKVPVAGSKIAAEWQQISIAGPGELSERVAPYVRGFLLWFVSQVGGFGMMVVHFLLTVVIAAILYSSGETAGRALCRFGRRLAGHRGENVIQLGAQAVRAVALGVVVTALIQSSLAGIGLAVAGIPYAAVLTAAIFLLGVAQLGPAPILLPVVIWLYWKGEAVWASALLGWALLVGSLDNFLRPALIRRGADLPFLLILAGVIGGLIGFGIIGLFIGPLVLAVTYTLLIAWTQGDELELEPGSKAVPTQLSDVS